MSFPPRFLDDLRARLPLSEVAGRSLKLTRAGREFRACCPFHKEKTPSFYINDDKGFYHCFGCGAHGDIVGFTMRQENLSFLEAVERLADAAGIPMPKVQPVDPVQVAREKTYYQVMEAAAAWFSAQLAAPVNRAVMAYLTDRGLSPDTIARFQLGYAPGDGMAMIHALKSAGFAENMMSELGLVKRREDGTFYSFFRDRVMFPVMDRNGRVIAFGGRVLPEHMREPSRGDFVPPKYLNSPETPLFHKGKIVYALSHVRAAAADHQPVVVVEGYMDVIACHQAGLTGAVAPLGTAMTEDQMTLLWRLISDAQKVITFCFDGDNAGRRAAFRAVMRMLPLLKPDHTARIVFLPDGEDPDTFILKQGVEAFRSYLERGTPLAEYVWEQVLAGRGGSAAITGPEGRAGLESELEKITASILDQKINYHYKNFFRDKIGALFARDQKGRSFQSSGAYRYNKQGGAFLPALRPPPTSVQGVRARAIDILFAILINHPKIFSQIDEIIGILDVSDDSRNQLRYTLMDVCAAQDFETPGDVQRAVIAANREVTATLKEVLSERVMILEPRARTKVEDQVAYDAFMEIYHTICLGTDDPRAQAIP